MSMDLPHDPVDLLLAPVALAIDARLREVAGLDRASLEERITVETNMTVYAAEDAQRAVLGMLTYLIDTHGWDIAWDARGVRLAHGDHHVVLGMPANLRAYVADFARPLAPQV
jgi:hypothetical protein